MSLTLTDSYQKALLMRNFLYGMEFTGGWVFGRVLTYTDIFYDYDRFIIDSTGDELLAANSALSAAHELQDADTNEILWVKETDHVYQVFSGISPPRMRLFRFYPEQTITGSLDDVPARQIPNATSFGFIADGRQSPYDDPTMMAETMIPKELRVMWQLFNPEAFAIFPLVKFIIRKLQVEWLNPENTSDKSLIDGIMGGRVPCHLWSPGDYQPDYSTRDLLHIAPTPWKFASRTSSPANVRERISTRLSDVTG